MMVPMGMMSPGQDSTIIKDHMQELVIMQTKPSDPGYAQGGNAQSQFVYVPMDMLQKMMSSKGFDSPTGCYVAPTYKFPAPYDWPTTWPDQVPTRMPWPTFAT